MAAAVGQPGIRRLIGAAVLCAGILAAPALARGGDDAGPSGPSGPVAPAVQQAESRPLGAASGKIAAERPAPGGGAAPAPAKLGFGQTIMALGGVLGLAMLAAAVVRKVSRGQGGLRASLGAGGRAPAGIMEILGRYPVGRGTTLVLLKLDRRVLLLSQSAGGRLGAGAGMATLCEITDPEEVASLLVKSRDADGDSMSERFRSMLSRFDRGMDGTDVALERSGRAVRVGAGGDRAELWDGSRASIPVVDLTRQPGAPEQTGAVGNLRRRLASFGREGRP